MSTARRRLLKDGTGSGQPAASTALFEAALSTVPIAAAIIDAERHGHEAIRMISADPAIDLIVTSLEMPGLGGREIADRLNASHRRTPILFLDAAASNAARIDGSASVHRIVAESVAAEQLLTNVREMLEARVRCSD